MDTHSAKCELMRKVWPYQLRRIVKVDQKAGRLIRLLVPNIPDVC